MKKYSWTDNDELRDALRRVMDSEYQADWCKSIEERGWTHRGEHILDSIQAFLSGSFLMNSNPLPHLRKLFPLDWQFHGFYIDGPDAQYIELMSTSDIFWPAEPGADEIYLVSA